MKKLLLTLVAALFATCSFAQKVTLDFSKANTEWGMPEGKDNNATEGTYSNGTYSITLSAASSGFYIPTKTADGVTTVSDYLLIGKQDATLTLPAFDFPVSKIKVYGNTGASTAVTMNIFVGDNAVSTEATSAAEDHVFEIAEANQAAGNVYVYKVTNAKNAQIKKIEIYAVGEEVAGGDVAEGTVTVAEALAATKGAEVTVAGQVAALTTKGYVIYDGTGFIYHYLNAAHEYAIGDKVTVTGKLDTYNGANQFTATATVTKGANAAVTYPTATVLDAAAAEAWVASPKNGYVTVSGTLSISGTYYNVTIDGTTAAVGSIILPTADLTEGLVSGSTITVTGAALYLSGKKYINIVATSIKIDNAVEDLDISNTPETAYTIAKAKELIAAGKGLDHKVYVKGTVVAEGLSIDTSYGNACFNIADGTDTLYLYRNYYLGNGESTSTKYTSEDQLKGGEEVIVYGQLTSHNGAAQMNQGNYIYSLNGITDGIKTVATADEKNAVIFDLAGRRVSKAGKGIYIINGKKVLK